MVAMDLHFRIEIIYIMLHDENPRAGFLMCSQRLGIVELGARVRHHWVDKKWCCIYALGTFQFSRIIGLTGLNKTVGRKNGK